jgi:hypothetical protein
MLRHSQVTGGRKWVGNDFVELQSVGLGVMDNFFKTYKSCVISGCEVSGSNVARGYVAFVWPESGEIKSCIAEFSGVTGVSVFPLYLILAKVDVTRAYETGGNKIIGTRYLASISYTIPAEGVPYVTIAATGATVTFRDALQSASYRFVTDAMINAWNGKQAALGFTPENAANKNQPGGYVGLKSNGKISNDYLESDQGTPQYIETYGDGTYQSAGDPLYYTFNQVLVLKSDLITLYDSKQYNLPIGVYEISFDIQFGVFGEMDVMWEAHVVNNSSNDPGIIPQSVAYSQRTQDSSIGIHKHTFFYRANYAAVLELRLIYRGYIQLSLDGAQNRFRISKIG